MQDIDSASLTGYVITHRFLKKETDEDSADDGKSLAGSRRKPTSGSDSDNNSVLLLDEVDVFFGDGFFGMPYRPSTDIDHPDGFNLIQHIWENRKSLQKTDESVATMLDLQAVKNLRNTFPNLDDRILKR
jgi:hypothetical protein